MVFFTCNACGESLKKGQVEKHTAMCRNCQCLSCIDCGKDFWGEDYKNHLKCISEDQKYGGKAFEAKANKGDVKQQQWIQRIHEVMKKPSITPQLKNILNQISTYDNIPRKKAKFQNWMKNSLRIHSQVLQDQVWEIFSEATSTPKEAANKDDQKQPIPEKTSEASASAEESEKKKSKRERKEERQKKNKKEKKDMNLEEPEENDTKKKGKKRKMDSEGQEGSENRTDKRKKRKQKEDDAEEQENGDVEEESEEPTSHKRRKYDEPDEAEDEGVENGEENSQKALMEWRLQILMMSTDYRFLVGVKCTLKSQNFQGFEWGPHLSPESEKITNGQLKFGGVSCKFNWKGTIKALLRQADDHELPIKKLRKKVIAQYYAVSSAQHKSQEELLATFNKKIQNNPKFRVLKERVKLIN
ncbi:cell growth-regulating nucleolar protein [Gastrophryne carolinensis]